jgi:hypothetical protein
MIEHRQAYNINIVNIGNDIIWKLRNKPFAFRYDNVIYITHRGGGIREEKVDEYIHLIKRMKSEWIYLNEEAFDAKYRECGLERKNKIVGVI